jgi:spore germination cell wall hydrolase CwlJ-like protein
MTRRSPLISRGKDGESWQVNWTARSLIAAGGVSVCLLMTALSATASIDRAAEKRAAAAVLADEAELVAGLADYLAAETESAREAFKTAPLTGAASTAEMVAREGAIADFVDFDFSKMVEARLDAEERKCLAQAIYFEAGYEPRIGQLAVADVVLNRVKHPAYPDSICGVVFEGSHRKTGCQFTFTCDGSMRRPVNKRRYEQAEELAGTVLAGLRAPVSRNATHYHADYVDPYWAPTLTPTAVIGTHKFYRFPRRTEVAEAPATM